MKLHGWAAAVVEFGSASDTTSRDPLPSWAQRLTRRQWEIAGLVGEGLDDQAIAAVLGCGFKTVRNQLSLVYQVLGIDHRTRLALMVQEWRLRGEDPGSTDPGQKSHRQPAGSGTR